MMRISKIRVRRMIDRLLNRSASDPAKEAKSRKGITKTAPASDRIVLECSGPLMVMRRKISKSLKILSLRAEKNCETLSAKKELKNRGLRNDIGKTIHNWDY